MEGGVGGFFALQRDGGFGDGWKGLCGSSLGAHARFATRQRRGRARSGRVWWWVDDCHPTPTPPSRGAVSAATGGSDAHFEGNFAVNLS